MLYLDSVAERGPFKDDRRRVWMVSIRNFRAGRNNALYSKTYQKATGDAPATAVHDTIQKTCFGTIIDMKIAANPDNAWVAQFLMRRMQNNTAMMATGYPPMKRTTGEPIGWHDRLPCNSSAAAWVRRKSGAAA